MIFFFFQAEDGIRDRDVTGVQTCALPISTAGASRNHQGGEVLIPISFSAHENHVAHLKVRELGVLPVFAVLGLVRNSDSDGGPVHSHQLQHTILDGVNFSEDWPAASLLRALHPACPWRRSGFLS